MRKCFKVVDKIKTHIVAAFVLPLFISHYFTQSHFRTLTENCVTKQDNSADDLTQKPRGENISTSHPNPTITDSPDLTDKTQQVRYSTCCRLLEFVVGLPKGR